MVWTFVCTEVFTIIKDKSNVKRCICICIFTENKFRLPPWSLLTTFTKETMTWKYTSLPIVNNIGHIKSQINNFTPKFTPVNYSTCLVLLLISTASLRRLVRQSLVLAVTLALYLSSSPWCALSWCFSINEVLVPALYLARCSLLLVYRLWEDSQM